MPGRVERRQHRARNIFDVHRPYGARRESLAPADDDIGDPGDLGSRLCRRQPKPLALRHEIVDARAAAVGTDREREVAPVEAHYRHWHEIIGGRQPPAVGMPLERMIARVVVRVGNCGIERHASE